MRPYVSVILPCRNEEKYIGPCLDSILANSYPRDRFELLVIDGMSEDKTREILSLHTARHPNIRVIENPKHHFSAAVNLGIKNSRGSLVMIMGAHASYAGDYISKCVEFSQAYDADNVGGVLITSFRKDTLIARSIALALSHPFAAGNSRFRTGSPRACWVDTVFGGCYKKSVFDKIGMFNEELPRSADMEFNLRLKNSGGRILLVPDIIAYYFPSSDLKSFASHNFNDGFWASYPLNFGVRIFSWRHLVSPVFTGSLISLPLLSFFHILFAYLFLFIVFAYFSAGLVSSFQIAIRNRNSKLLIYLPVIFATRHILYGLGFWHGFLKSLSSQRFWGNLFGRKSKPTLAK